MSYTYLLAAGEESSAGCFSEIIPSALSKSSHIAARLCCNGRGTESCHGSRSGMMSRPSMASRGTASLMSSAGASHAKTSLLPARVKESRAKDQDFGKRWPASSAKWNPDTSSWKTHQCSLLEGWESFSETWPKWGMMLDGEFWELPAWVPNTDENEYGFLPTPLASDGDGGGICRTKNGREYNLRDWWANQGLGGKRQQRRPEFWEWVMGWPENWSALEPLETDKFQSWLQRHGAFFHTANDKLTHGATP